jgi:peptidoglycan/LPS O-acetylase OafA/YrhL
MAHGDSRNLDYLRSVAVLAVAASHFYGLAGGPRFKLVAHNLGVGGVCFFFVHTCLVLFASMNRSRSPRLAASFYIRRAFRIFPLCWVCIVLVLATGWTDNPNATLAALGWRGLAVNLMLIQNMIRFPSVVGPLWSLPWEVQMYLVLPALYLILNKSRRPLAMSIGLWCCFTALAIAVTAFHLPRAFDAAVIPPMFLGGVVAYHLGRTVLPSIPSVAWLPLVPALLGLRCFLLEGDSIESTHNGAVNASVCLLLGLAIPLFKEMSGSFLPGAARSLAKYSYGIYLFHVPVLVAVFRYCGSFPLAAKACIFVAVTAAASIAGYRTIEHPLIKAGRLLADRLDSVASKEKIECGVNWQAEALAPVQAPTTFESSSS